MGTSISQPSPKRIDEGGHEWSALKDIFENDVRNDRIFPAIYQALTIETHGFAIETIVDSGVSIVERKLLKLSVKQESVDDGVLANFINEVRFELAIGRANSLFAELALSSAVRCSHMSSGRVIFHRFIVEYLTTLADYFISRDLPETYGASGLSSPQKIQNRIESIRKSLDESLTDVYELNSALKKIMRIAE